MGFIIDIDDPTLGVEVKSDGVEIHDEDMEIDLSWPRLQVLIGALARAEKLNTPRDGILCFLSRLEYILNLAQLSDEEKVKQSRAHLRSLQVYLSKGQLESEHF